MDRIHRGRGSRRKGCLISKMTHSLRRGLGAPAGLTHKGILAVLGKGRSEWGAGPETGSWESEGGEHVETDL